MTKEKCHRCNCDPHCDEKKCTNCDNCEVCDCHECLERE